MRADQRLSVTLDPDGQPWHGTSGQIVPGAEAPGPRLTDVVEVDLGFPRSWLEFTDPAEPGRTFRCDTTWLLSSWTCIFGRGCPGIYADAPDAGCCALGAHFADDADRARVKAWAAKLDAEVWQNHAVGKRRRRRQGCRGRPPDAPASGRVHLPQCA